MKSESVRGRRSFLDVVERLGNYLPEPIMLFVWLIIGLMILSAVGDAFGWAASVRYAGNAAPLFGELDNGVLTYSATSLFSEENVARLLGDMPRTLSGFAPLGFVLTIVYGASIAERSGLFSAAIRGSLRRASPKLLTPIVAMIGMMSHHASDLGYLVVIPLAAILYASVGRHPLVGLAAAFAGVSGGGAGNVTPSQIDVLLFSFTQEAARIVDPNWTMNPLGNWWYILTIVIVFTPIIWFITDKVIEPRLGPWTGEPDEELQAEVVKSELTDAERRGLRWALVAALAVIGLYVALSTVPGYTPLIDEAKQGTARFQPLFASLLAGFFLLFVSAGTAFGIGTGAITNYRQVTGMMAEGVRVLAPYLVFIFFAAHFVAMFSWSRLGPIFALEGASALGAMDLPAPFLLVGVQFASSFLDLFIGSNTAKWSALAPVVVPMFMLLGISPEMTTAAYRMGDSYTSIMTPLMSYFPLILGFARRYDSNFGVGSLLALMLPYALSFMVAGLLMTFSWVALDLPLGPGAQVFYTAPHGR